MVHRTYQGLGAPEAAVREFDALRPYAADLVELRGACAFGSPDHAAIGIAYEGLQTAAFHFTRRAQFYRDLETAPDPRAQGNGRLSDRAEAAAAFAALKPHVLRLRALRSRCRPFGRDYLALDIALQSLATAAFHFTREAAFYGERSDSSGPVR